MGETLLPCPFCTKGPRVDVRNPMATDGVTHWVVCRACGACGPVSHADQAAIAAWNRRAGLLTEDKPREADAMGVAAGLVELVEELIEEAEVNAATEYPKEDRQKYPVMQRRYDRAMDLPRRARTALAAIRSAEG